MFGGLDGPGGRLGGLELGVVLSNSDSENKGTLKIQLLRAGQSDNILSGVKMLAASAGEHYGAYLLPEVGEQVVVGFLGGCFDRPVVLGSLYAAGDSYLSDSYHEENRVKRFRTKGGSVVEFVDADEGKEQIAIKTPQNLSLLLKEDGRTITLEAKDASGQSGSTPFARVELDGAGGSVTLTASSTVCLQVKDGATLTLGAETAETKGKKISLKAETSIKQKSGGSLKLESKQADLKADAVKQEASGLFQLKGSMVKVN